MKKLIKEVFNYEIIIGCYISAVGYGIGYWLANYFNLHIVICIIASIALGLIFDKIGAYFLNKNSIKNSLQGKATFAACVYSFYLAAWAFAYTVLGHDLDDDFLSNLGLIIVLQVVLMVIEAIKIEIKSKKTNNK